MAQVSYGTITITDTTDIERIYVEYCRSTSNQLSDGTVPGITVAWSENTPPWVNGQYIWQRSVVKKSGSADLIYGTPVCLTGAAGATGAAGRGLTATVTKYCNYGTGEPAANYSGWVDAPPSYDSSKPNYWVKITNTYSVAPTSENIIYKDEALTKAVTDAAIANSIAQQTIEDAQGAMSQAASNLNSVVRLWYAKANSTAPAAPTSGITTGSTSTYNAWSTVKPADNASYQYYFYCDQSRTSGGVYSWSSVTLDTSTLSQYQIGALTTKVKNFWWDSNGAHVASGKNGNKVTTNTISTYGYHALMGLTGISFNYDNAKVVDLNSTTPSLDFYQPPTISGSTVTQGKKTMMLSANALRFYNPIDGTTEQAVLDTNGLVLKKGGVKAGTSNTNNYVYISSENGPRIAINGYTPPDPTAQATLNAPQWREIIGTKFGVLSDGTLYANEAHVSGAIKATSGIIGNNAQNKIIIGDNTANASIYSGSHSTLASTANGFYIGTDGLSIGSNFKVTTAGALTASNLTVNSGSIANSVTIGGKNQSEYLNDNIEVGGRNLLYNSGTMPAVSSGNKGWRASGGTVSHIDISTPPIAGISGGIRCTNTGSSVARVGIAQDLLANRFIAGKKYSMGCWIRASAGFSSDVSIQPIWISSSQTTNSKYISMTLSTNWQYISAEGLTLAGDQASSYSAGYVYASNVPAGGYIEVCGIMLEEGTKCTSWTPAPEDVASDIEDASKVADNFLHFDPQTGLDIGYTGKIEHTNIKGDGMRIYDSTGSAEPVASFLSTGSTIGKAVDGESRTVTSNKGMQFYKRSGSDDIILAHIGYDQGVDEDGNTNTYAPYYTFGKRKSGSAIGNYSMAEGTSTTASGYSSHAEGNYATAMGYYSHAEGAYTEANGDASHAEGSFTTAGDKGAHAEGIDTEASAYASHAQNSGTIAQGYSQTAIGMYNKKQGSASSYQMTDYAFIIGNGNGTRRSNAFAVDWNGDIYPRDTKMVDFIIAQGSITGGTNNTSWRYRKWFSGRVEAWAEVSFGSVAPNDVWVVPIYYIDKSITIPEGIFSSAPSNIFITGGGSQWTPVGTFSIGLNGFSCRFIKPSGSSQSLWVRVYAIKY